MKYITQIVRSTLLLGSLAATTSVLAETIPYIISNTSPLNQFYSVQNKELLKNQITYNTDTKTINFKFDSFELMEPIQNAISLFGIGNSTNIYVSEQDPTKLYHTPNFGVNNSTANFGDLSSYKNIIHDAANPKFKEAQLVSWTISGKTQLTATGSAHAALEINTKPTIPGSMSPQDIQDMKGIAMNIGNPTSSQAPEEGKLKVALGKDATIDSTGAITGNPSLPPVSIDLNHNSYPGDNSPMPLSDVSLTNEGTIRNHADGNTIGSSFYDNGTISATPAGKEKHDAACATGSTNRSC
ncbi:hypothetical protein OQ257_08545 [Actinobacillus equuli subsp. equuli]|uniref:Uncharacterized protein n=1 Tax=Actinobacillus equuli subsp. equuli TaxID=202947 RepID=A0A9X4G4K0_ACTEU|nr:hypothetical protein [Actinobacillus equuli]MDE8035211.1 hypothetical protein [Actinobacillus equuli subsp. equuli]